MTRKHFEAIAAEFKKHIDFLDSHHAVAAGFDDGYYTGYRYAVEVLAEAQADYFATQNPNFDRNRFLAACGI